uniref:Uncharacterized protein n=1 Tax=Ditylenchus dipsaci TaxID=166011 RepID=A0A915DSJ8_9BILA
MPCLVQLVVLVVCINGIAGQFPSWPTATGTKKADTTISVASYLDGGFVRYTAGSALGDGGVAEGQLPIFELKAGQVSRM